MRRFSNYLAGNGLPNVSSFTWSGGLIRGLRASDAAAYAIDLSQCYMAARHAGGSLSIVAKSQGCVIAERALVLLNGAIEVDLFLRIGVPYSGALRLPHVARIVNVTSSEDRLFLIGTWLMPFVWRRPAASIGTKPDEIRLVGLSH